MNTHDDWVYARQQLAHEGVDTARMGEAQARAAHPNLDDCLPLDAYVLGFREGVHALAKLVEAHPDRPDGLDLLVMIDKLAHPDAH